MTQQNLSSSKHSNAYNPFIIALTIFSSLIMVVMLLPLDEDTLILLQFYICFIFLVDFVKNLRASSPKSEYFIKERSCIS